MSITQALSTPSTVSADAAEGTQSVSSALRGDRCEVAGMNSDRVARARASIPASTTLLALAETFRALGDPTRLRIVTALTQGELSVCDLATIVEVSESAVSHSFRTLRQLRLVRFRRAGRIAYYSLDDAHVVRLVAEGISHVDEATSQPSGR
jgi:ArsR family transcriptional regulator, lead/cadmium/zinc/bismuth-responsive transcriptional repressor